LKELENLLEPALESLDRLFVTLGILETTTSSRCLIFCVKFTVWTGPTPEVTDGKYRTGVAFDPASAIPFSVSEP
jgi:hypothetical protein